MSAVAYNPKSNVVVRFYDQLKFGLKPNIQKHEENFLEALGNHGTWFVEVLPGKVKSLLSDPRVVTVALTAIALVADSYLFYPGQTAQFLAHVVSHVNIKDYLWAVKFAVYVLSVETVLSFSARAYGRFSNSELTNAFYNKAAGGAYT